MITWLTRLSFFDTAEDLTDNHLALQAHHGNLLVNYMRWDKQPPVGHGTEPIQPNNPVLRMWQGYERALGVYCLSMVADLARRGYYMTSTSTELSIRKFDDFELPPWWGDTDVLRSHRSNLARRWPKLYGKKWSGTPARMPYIFPLPDDSMERGYRLVISAAERRLLDLGERSIPTDVRNRMDNLK